MLGVELALRLWDYSPPPRLAGDPFLSLSSSGPLFVRDESGPTMVTAENRLLCFRRQEFSIPKAPGTIRIFCLGGSTVQGHPFSVETSFTTWLALNLQAADPSRKWEVINCGGVSYATYRLAPILEEVTQYQPDLIILCCGHNEFLEGRSYYRGLADRYGLLRGPLGMAGRLRIFQGLRAGYNAMSGTAGSREFLATRPILPAEVDALLDYQGGLDWFRQDPQWRQGVVDHFAYSVARMLQTARAAGVPCLVVQPAANLLTPPFKPLPGKGRTPYQARRIEALMAETRAVLPSNPSGAAHALRSAVSIDKEDAGLWYLLGTSLRRMGRNDEARESLSRARDLDVCPLRITLPMREVLKNAAARAGVPLVDMEKLFADRSEDGIPGSALMVDHVHPSIPGHQLVAEAIFQEMARQKWVARPVDDVWITRRDQLYRQNLASLDDLYYLRAEQRLQNLEDWARGRAERLKAQGAIAEEVARANQRRRSSTKSEPPSKE